MGPFVEYARKVFRTYCNILPYLSDIPLAAHDIRNGRALQNDLEDMPGASTSEPTLVGTPPCFATPMPDHSSPLNDQLPPSVDAL
jgi:hypothetical protein